MPPRSPIFGLDILLTVSLGVSDDVVLPWLQVGTAVVTRHTDNRLALGRLGSLVEQLHALVRSGRQVILVTSGAVCVGRQVCPPSPPRF